LARLESELGYTKNSVRMQHVQNTLVKWKVRKSFCTFIVFFFFSLYILY
jgi:hypothetical protein